MLFILLQRTMCALACLMTADLLSLEQMFVVVRSRLRQLSEGPPGPVANKATKVKPYVVVLRDVMIHQTV